MGSQKDTGWDQFFPSASNFDGNQDRNGERVGGSEAQPDYMGMDILPGFDTDMRNLFTSTDLLSDFTSTNFWSDMTADMPPMQAQDLMDFATGGNGNLGAQYSRSAGERNTPSPRVRQGAGAHPPAGQAPDWSNHEELSRWMRGVPPEFPSQPLRAMTPATQVPTTPTLSSWASTPPQSTGSTSISYAYPPRSSSPTPRPGISSAATPANSSSIPRARPPVVPSQRAVLSNMSKVPTSTSGSSAKRARAASDVIVVESPATHASSPSSAAHVSSTIPTSKKRKVKPVLQPAPIDVHDSSDEEDNSDADIIEDRSGKHWSVKELSRVVNAGWGADSDVYGSIQLKHYKHAAQKIWELHFGLKSGRTIDSVEGQIKKITAIYPHIRLFFKFTGGAGDSDLGDDVQDAEGRPILAAITSHLNRMKAKTNTADAAGHLKKGECQRWIEGGWYDIVHGRSLDKPSIERKTAFSSEREPSPPPSLLGGDAETPASTPAPSPPPPSASSSRATPMPAGRPPAHVDLPPPAPSPTKGKGKAKGKEHGTMQDTIQDLGSLLKAKSQRDAALTFIEVEEKMYRRLHEQQKSRYEEAKEELGTLHTKTHWSDERREQVRAECEAIVDAWRNNTTIDALTIKAREQAERTLQAGTAPSS